MAKHVSNMGRGIIGSIVRRIANAVNTNKEDMNNAAEYASGCLATLIGSAGSALKRVKHGEIIASMSAVVMITAGVATGNIVHAAEPETCNGSNYHLSCDGFYYQPVPNGPAYNATGIKAIADDLSNNGKGSKYYPTFHDAMMNDTGRGRIWFHDDKNPTGTDVVIRLIGINQDLKADKTGKAGLTFQALQYNTASRPYWNLPDATGSWSNGQVMNNLSTNKGGWGSSILRKNMNSGPMWNALPDSVKSNVTPILKRTNDDEYPNQNSSQDDSLTVTNATTSNAIDKLWIATPKEVGFVNTQSAGATAHYWRPDYKVSNDTYEFWSPENHDFASAEMSGTSGYYLWFRAPSPYSGYSFAYFYHSSSDSRYLDYGNPNDSSGVLPALSF